MNINIKSKEALKKRFISIEQEFQKWVPALKDLSRYVSPLRGRFSGDVPNRGTMIDHQTVLDGHASQASRILASGMQSGVTSPTRPWIALRVVDPMLMAIHNVRVWLDTVSGMMHDICNNTNVYGVFYSMYEEIACFGTACAIILEDFDSVVRALVFTAGEYYLGADDKGVINTFGRRMKLTVAQCVKAFGRENCSATVQNLYDMDKLDEWIDVRHLIEPNDKRIEGFADSQNMPFRSVYWEESQSAEGVLAFRGFEEFPVIAPRWDTVTTDTVYGYGPGWNALGNVKQLQKTHLDKLLAQEKAHNPPVQKDSSVDGHPDLLPGGVTTSSSTLPNAGVRPAYQVNANLESFIELIGSLREAINKDFFVDMFLMMVNFDKSNMTATEVAERQQEKMLMLGPVLERLQREMLDPFVERLYNIMERNMLLPEAPEELQDVELKVEYVSVLAQAQKAVGVNAISRVIGFVNGVVPVKNDAVDVINIDESIREVALLEGVPSRLMMSKNVVDKIREQRAQAQQMQQQMAMAETASKTAKNASLAKLDTDNVLSRVAERIPGS
ncbi:MAG: phage head-tail adapter protein [Clostridia bacterium]|nr:phage head-tail adapter protein [Clostridia bacterium]